MKGHVLKLTTRVENQAKIIAGLRSENIKLKTELTVSLNTNVDLQKNNESNNAISQNFVTTLNSYKEQVETLHNQVSSLTTQINQKTNKPHIIKLRAQVSELTNKLQIKDEEISKLKINGSLLAETLEKLPTQNKPVSEDTYQLQLELNTVNEILHETQQQLQDLVKSNISLQQENNKSKLQVKSRPNLQARPKIRQQINKLKKVINNKNVLINTKNKKIEELNNAVPKVIVKIEGQDAKELSIIPLRKKIFEIINRPNNKSIMHIHINDTNVVELNDAHLKNKLEALINKSKEAIDKRNKELSRVHVHLADKSTIDLDDSKLKNRLEKLINESELIARNAKININKLKSKPKTFGNLTLGNIQEDPEEDNDEDEEDNEIDIGQEDEQDDDDDDDDEEDDDDEQDEDEEAEDDEDNEDEEADDEDT